MSYTPSQRLRDAKCRGRRVWRRYCPSCARFAVVPGETTCSKCGAPASRAFAEAVEVEEI